MADLSRKNQQPRLFGISNSNRDFRKAKNWGKNIFNNAFPIALTCYMDAQELQPVYLTLDKNKTINHDYIEVTELFGISPNDADTFFAFESDFTPYRSLVDDGLPRADLVVQNDETGLCTTGFEIKLTALPDNSTYDFSDEQFGTELVVRPDTIVYIALGIAYAFKDHQLELAQQLQAIPTIVDWADIEVVSPIIPIIAEVLDDLMLQNLDLQKPLVLQPVWKTVGRQLQLHNDAFDVFVWSDFAFTRLFFRDAKNIKGKPSRGARTIVWLAKMLLDFATEGQVDYKWVIDSMSYNTKNDKAFAVNGRVTQPFMTCAELTTPRIKKTAVKDIILGGGQEFLSPERRLDAAIISTPDLFGSK